MGIKGIPKGTDISQLLFPSELVLTNVSHTLFELSSTHESRSLYKCQQGPVSGWALDLFLKEFERHERDFVAILYKRLAGLSGAQTLCGRMFERQVLNHLDAINNHHKFSIRSLTTSIEMEWLYRGPIQRFTFQTSTIIKAIDDAFTCQNSVHLVPFDPNFPAVDSILYDPDSEVLTCIQVTTHDKHDIKVSGLQRIQRWLKLQTPLADLRPSNAKPWRFIFIVPSDMSSDFALQKFDGDTVRHSWAGKVDQYVLGLEEILIFPKAKRDEAVTI